MSSAQAFYGRRKKAAVVSSPFTRQRSPSLSASRDSFIRYSPPPSTLFSAFPHIEIPTPSPSAVSMNHSSSSNDNTYHGDYLSEDSKPTALQRRYSTDSDDDDEDSKMERKTLPLETLVDMNDVHLGDRVHATEGQLVDWIGIVVLNKGKSLLVEFQIPIEKRSLTTDGDEDDANAASVDANPPPVAVSHRRQEEMTHNCINRFQAVSAHKPIHTPILVPSNHLVVATTPVSEAQVRSPASSDSSPALTSIHSSSSDFNNYHHDYLNEAEDDNANWQQQDGVDNHNPNSSSTVTTLSIDGEKTSSNAESLKTFPNSSN
ncbi:hypothetical protein IV203_033420 [Nitzschia inconspicua]|uniref:Uncharacterized protein n=1 Tax=Nitzschia inconspicua TaxID=303405 RepID=A0A9K3P7F7_9STRA|nr:hypothetical protein IV203_033420 [Nitzschia inconspicua]